MKKIYITLFASLFIGQIANAQLSLTKLLNEPTVGDINGTKDYDSVGVVPKNIGTGLTWNFSAFTQNTVVALSTFSNPASVPASTAFAGVTIVEDQTAGNYNFWKSTSTPTTQFELVGIQTGTTATLNFTNSLIAAVWPINYGYNMTDAVAGNATTSFGNGPINGTSNFQATGTGTLIAPGGANFSNILQTRSTQTVNIVLGTFPSSFTLNTVSTSYSYYHSSSKFPLISVDYQKQTLSSIAGPTVTNTTKIKANTAVITGLNDKNFDATFQIFPNPATNYFNVNLSNSTNQVGTISIYNTLGQAVKTINLGNETTLEKNISIADLKSGIYIVKTTLGNKSSSRKLIVE